MNKTIKQKSTPEIREYLRKHPDCSYEDLIKTLDLKSLSKPWFYVLRRDVRKAKSGAAKNGKVIARKDPANGLKPIMTVEILESLDASGFSPEMRKEFVSHFQPMIRQVAPGGQSLQVVVLEHPARIEIRRLIS